MVYLNNNSFSGDNWKDHIEGVTAIGTLVAVAIFLFVGFCKIMEFVRWNYDYNNANNPPEEVPLRQGIMNEAIPNSRDGDIEIPLVAGNAEGNAEDWV